MTPLKPQLDAIAALETREDIARMMGRAFMASFISAGVGTDAKNPKRYLVKMSQSGIGLPSPEYFMTAGEPFEGVRAAYLAYITDVFTRAGIAEADTRAKAILDLETQIAGLHWTAAEKRDPVRSYNLMTRDALEAYAPGFAWGAYLDEAGFGDVTELVLSTDTLGSGVGASSSANRRRDDEGLSDVPLHRLPCADAVRRSGERSFRLPQHAPCRNRPAGIRREPRGGNHRRHAGRAARAGLCQGLLPARITARRWTTWSPTSGRLQARLEANAWMDEPTRKEALAKLEAIVSNIGYPDQWRDYLGPQTGPGRSLGNVMQLTEFENADARQDPERAAPRLDVADHCHGRSTPATCRRSTRSPSRPAILQPPVLRPHADPAVNYGAIGAVIGHEMGHGFDDQGSQSDAGRQRCATGGRMRREPSSSARRGAGRAVQRVFARSTA